MKKIYLLSICILGCGVSNDVEDLDLGIQADIAISKSDIFVDDIRKLDSFQTFSDFYLPDIKFKIDSLVTDQFTSPDSYLPPDQMVNPDSFSK